MCGICTAYGHAIGSTMYILQRLLTCFVMTLMTACVIVTILIVLGVGIGLGYHYCVVQMKTRPITGPISKVDNGTETTKSPKGHIDDNSTSNNDQPGGPPPPGDLPDDPPENPPPQPPRRGGGGPASEFYLRQNENANEAIRNLNQLSYEELQSNADRKVTKPYPRYSTDVRSTKVNPQKATKDVLIVPVDGALDLKSLISNIIRQKKNMTLEFIY